MKTFFKLLVYLLTAVVVLAAAAFAVLMLPAHWQIRSVDVEIPSAQALQSVLEQVGEVDYPREIRFINTAQQRTTLGVLGHPGVLIRWQDGKSFLIDTGMNEAEAIAFGKPLEILGAGPTETFGPVEAQLGTAINSIAGIGFTHLHQDHTASTARICAAMVSPATVYQTATQQNLHNLHTRAGQALINQSNCSQRLLGTSTIKSVPGFSGLFALAAGGHTPGSTIFVTRVNGKTWIFAGDISNSMADIYSNRGKGFLYSYLLIPEQVDLLRQWRVWLKNQDERDDVQVLVAHDVNAYRASSLKAWRPETWTTFGAGTFSRPGVL